MDPVRLGRVLGTGARAAAKTVVSAMDAATAPNPNPARANTSNPHAPPRVQPTIIQPPRPATARTPQPQTAAATTARTAAGVREGAKRFGREVWNPFRRVSGVLWLEFTGVFFGIFALFALGATWKLRHAWHTTPFNTADHDRLLGAIFMLAVFGYFTVSSFVRASRRGRLR